MFAYFLTVDHVMGFGDRYFYPLLPVLSVLGGVGIARMTATLSPQAGIWIKPHSFDRRACAGGRFQGGPELRGRIPGYANA